MAEALARRRWPTCHVASAGIRVQREGGSPAQEAISVMAHMGLDIRHHRAKSLSDYDLSSFQWVLALDKNVKLLLTTQHNVETSKIIDFFINDPYGADITRYVKCANEIKKKIASLFA
jgi:protein-tyrosine-phosphatase